MECQPAPRYLWSSQLNPRPIELLFASSAEKHKDSCEPLWNRILSSWYIFCRYCIHTWSPCVQNWFLQLLSKLNALTCKLKVLLFNHLKRLRCVSTHLLNVAWANLFMKPNSIETNTYAKQLVLNFRQSKKMLRSEAWHRDQEIQSAISPKWLNSRNILFFGGRYMDRTCDFHRVKTPEIWHISINNQQLSDHKKSQSSILVV